MLKASQQRTVLILNLRHQIGYEGISLLTGKQLAVGRRKKKIFAFFPRTSSLFLLPTDIGLTSFTSGTLLVAELPSSLEPLLSD
ncbi:hypothetical protein [Microcoleus sp. F4-D5]|uniref:hypothetical protein n=1 Tax=Microcoleus sp. F4-D5 TaxID=2818760 RepID=UPI002FD5CDB5